MNAEIQFRNIIFSKDFSWGHRQSMPLCTENYQHYSGAHFPPTDSHENLRSLYRRQWLLGNYLAFYTVFILGGKGHVI